MEQKSRAFARRGIANIFARQGFREFLSRPRLEFEPPAPFPHQPHRGRRNLGGGEFCDRIRRLLLPCAGELRRHRRNVALWARRVASARAARSCDQARTAALRFHHRRRTLQAGMVRQQPGVVRLQHGGDLARLAVQPVIPRTAPDKTVHQTNANRVAPCFFHSFRTGHASWIATGCSRDASNRLPAQQSRSRRSLASWATWTCCSRSRRLGLLVPSSRGRAFPRCTRAMQGRV